MKQLYCLRGKKRYFYIKFPLFQLKATTIPELRQMKFVEGVGAVVIGSDPNFNYLKMFKATNFLANPEVLLIQTHVPTVIAYNPILPGEYLVLLVEE